MVEKIVRKLFALVEQADYRLFLQSYDLACRHCGGSSQAQWFACQRSLAAKFVWSADCDDSFLAKLGDDSNFHFAGVNVKNRIRWIAL